MGEFQSVKTRLKGINIHWVVYLMAHMMKKVLVIRPHSEVLILRRRWWWSCFLFQFKLCMTLSLFSPEWVMIEQHSERCLTYFRPTFITEPTSAHSSSEILTRSNITRYSASSAQTPSQRWAWKSGWIQSEINFTDWIFWVETAWLIFFLLPTTAVQNRLGS